MGVFAMLEEECIVPKATDQTYLQKMHKQHGGNNTSYTKPTPKQSKAGGGDFILHHYAGSVGYSVAGWLEKNKDPINEHSAQLFSKGTDALVSHLFQDYNPDGKSFSLKDVFTQSNILLQKRAFFPEYRFFFTLLSSIEL